MDINLLREMLLDLPVRDIFRLCPTNKMFNKICHDVDFWEEYLQENLLLSSPIPGLDFRETVIEYARWLNLITPQHYISHPAAYMLVTTLHKLPIEKQLLRDIVRTISNANSKKLWDMTETYLILIHDLPRLIKARTGRTIKPQVEDVPSLLFDIKDDKYEQYLEIATAPTPYFTSPDTLEDIPYNLDGFHENLQYNQKRGNLTTQERLSLERQIRPLVRQQNL